MVRAVDCLHLHARLVTETNVCGLQTRLFFELLGTFGSGLRCEIGCLLVKFENPIPCASLYTIPNLLCVPVRAHVVGCAST